MMINDLITLENTYNIYGDSLFESTDFINILNKAKESFDFNFLIMLAYEAKDFGKSIEKNTLIDKIFGFFSEFPVSSKYYFSKSLLFKYYVFNNKYEYLDFYKENILKKSESEILEIFKNSFENLFYSIAELKNAISNDDKTDVFYSHILFDEFQECFNILKNIGFVKTEDSGFAYLWIDQIDNKEFYSYSASLLFEWCKKNA